MVGTQGGAKVLGRDDVGRIAPGMAADFVAWRTDSLCFSGAQHDLVAALLFCTPGMPSVDLSVINGEVIVRDGEVLTCNVKVGFLLVCKQHCCSAPLACLTWTVSTAMTKPLLLSMVVRHHVKVDCSLPVAKCLALRLMYNA